MLVPPRWLPKSEYLNEQARRRYAIAPLETACKLTGLEPEQLLQLGAEELTRQYADGRREHALRLPAEFVPGSAQTRS